MRSTIDFQLQPFQSDENSKRFQIHGKIQRKNKTMKITYHVEGALSELEIESLSSPLQRQNELWQKTCFEIFISPQGEQKYWEWNFSPASHWNAFAFSTYRSPQSPHLADVKAPRIQMHEHSQSIEIEVEFELPQELATENLELSVTGILKDVQGTRSFWAIQHSGSQPDFHLRSSFSVKL